MTAQTLSHSDESLLSGLFRLQVAAELETESAARRAAEEAARDHVGERLIADGFFPNDYLLEHDGSLNAWSKSEQYSYPWNLPSRMFQFPAKTLRGPDGVRRIGLRHPLLVNHPLIQDLISKGYDVCSPEECVNECDVSMAFMDNSEWWHAVDLIGKNPTELLKTSQFSTDMDIAAAVSYRCLYPHSKGPLTELVREMREVLTAIEVPELSADRSLSILATFDKPEPSSSDDGSKKSKPRWHVNTSRATKSAESGAIAWVLIRGIEMGWFQSVAGYLNWSEKGRACWEEVALRGWAFEVQE